MNRGVIRHSILLAIINLVSQTVKRRQKTQWGQHFEQASIKFLLWNMIDGQKEREREKPRRKQLILLTTPATFNSATFS